MSTVTAKEDIEKALRIKYEAGHLDTGLFNTGLCWVVMDNVDGELQFQWFDEAVELNQAVLQAALAAN